MDGIASGSATAFLLYDVGEGIDLGGVRTLIDATVRALGTADVDGFRVRFKAFGYGVVSVALTRAPHETRTRCLSTSTS